MISSSVFAIAGRAKRRREYRDAGWLYVAHNPSFTDEEAFKIGQPKRPPSVRVGKLSASTSVYEGFTIGH